MEGACEWQCIPPGLCARPILWLERTHLPIILSARSSSHLKTLGGAGRARCQDQDLIGCGSNATLKTTNTTLKTNIATPKTTNTTLNSTYTTLNTTNATLNTEHNKRETNATLIDACLYIGGGGASFFSYEAVRSALADGAAKTTQGFNNNRMQPPSMR